MVIEINQIQNGLNNEFDIYINKVKKYTGYTSGIVFFRIKEIEKLDKTIIKDLNGNEILYSNYDCIENNNQIDINSKRLSKYTILTKENMEECTIVFPTARLLIEKYMLQKDNKIYDCYINFNGYFMNISIYDKDIQIAELVKLNAVRDAKDEYKIFLKDEYINLANTLIAFSLHVDRILYSREFSKNTTNVTYLNYTNKFKEYNPNWIKENFDAIEYYNEFESKIKSEKNHIKNVFLIAGIATTIFVVLLIIALLIIFF